jgi:hypothetical protein
MDACSQLCKEIAAQHTRKNGLQLHAISLQKLKTDDIGMKRNSDYSMMRSGVPARDDFNVRSIKKTTNEFINQSGRTQSISNSASQGTRNKLEECCSVNGICLEDLEAFEAQLLEVKYVKLSNSTGGSAGLPIFKAAVLGSRSASSLTKHPKNLNTTNPRLSLSCNSQIGRRAFSAAIKGTEQTLPSCSHEMPQFHFDNSICLTKVNLVKFS